MARARNIKPGFFRNELLGSLDPMASLLFIGLWTIADRRGILEDRPLRIKADIFPYRENLDINGYLTELERSGFIVRFLARGLRLIHIPNFTKHQSPHPTEKASEFPGAEEKDHNTHIDVELPVKSTLDNGSLHVAATLNPYSLNPESLFTDSLKPDSLNPDTKPLPRAKARAAHETRELWQAYSKAYFARYGTEPLRNAKVNGMLARFIERVGLEAAPQIATHYLRSQSFFYARSKHPVDLLLRDAETLHTEWKTGRQGTDAEARQGDKTAATGNVFANLLLEAQRA